MHVIGTAGHVDHGKSTLVERLTGIDPDRFAEEKRRGLTIDLGFAWLRLPSGNEVGLIDVPGHERFIKNMLAGAGGISVCLFVVAANEGWKPQSAEHLSIVDLLGIESGVVAVTKSDTVDDETLALRVKEITERLAPSSLKGSRVVPCSATTGAGIDELIAALDEVVSATPRVSDHARPRLWVDRVFTIAGAGTVVTGTLAGGSFRAGMEVEISPEGRRARIRGIQSHKKSVDEIEPGNRVALNLVGLDREGAERGDAVVQTKQWRPTDRIDAVIRVLPGEVSGHDHELSEKGAHLLYVGSAETPVRLKLLDKEKIGPGESGLAQISLRDPLPLSRGDRFVLRDAGRVLTFGGGDVLDPLPQPARRNDTARIELLEKLRGAAPVDAALALVEAEGSLAISELRSRAGIIEAEIPGARWLDDVLVSNTHYEELVARVHDALARHHAEHPLERGMQRETLRGQIAIGSRLFDALIEADDEVVSEEALVHLHSHGVALSPDQQQIRDDVIGKIESGGFTPPLEKELEIDSALLRSFVDAGELVRIDGFFLTPSQAAEARSKVRAAIEAEGPKTVAEIRDLLGTTRKYAVPLCEWLDRTGATRRHGDVRTLGPNP